MGYFEDKIHLSILHRILWVFIGDSTEALIKKRLPLAYCMLRFRVDAFAGGLRK
jgi:hypothetical protein